MKMEQIITFNYHFFYIIILTRTRVFEVRASKLHYYRGIFYLFLLAIVLFILSYMYLLFNQLAFCYITHIYIYTLVHLC